MRFDLTDLRLFCDVADSGSITKGAERSRLALAAASTRIRGMELEIGADLLVRGRQGVSPTLAGQTLLKHARPLLEQSARLREDLAQFGQGAAGEVRVLANTNASTEFLPEALSVFLAANPHVRIDLEERLSDEIVGMIADGVGEVGIVAGTVDVGGLETFPFRSDRFVVVTGAAHPMAGRPQTSFAEVLDHDFVGLERTSAHQRFLADKAARLGAPLRLRVQLRSFDAVCRLVETNVGVGIVPHTTARRAAAIGALRIIELSDDWAVRELSICVRRFDDLRPTARDLVLSLKR